MVEINGKKLCENCFEETKEFVCPCCGYDSEKKTDDFSLLTPGTVLNSRYVVGGSIGKDGFGVTYLAYDALVRKKVAIKEYFPYGIASRGESHYPNISIYTDKDKEMFEESANKFIEEACLVKKFNDNPNIVSVYETFFENSTAYYTMEYLRGRTLKDYISRQSLLNTAQALHIALNVTNALMVMHSANVLHRDISPDNIMVCDNGDIKLIDFGLARQIMAEYTQMFSTILKPGFAPLEQYQKKGNQGPWTDVYSLGAVLYYALTGDIPEDPTACLNNDETFGENLFNIERGMWEIIVKAASVQVEKRFADAYEMNRALKALPYQPEPLEVSGEQVEEEEPVDIFNSDFTIKTVKPKKRFLKRHLRTVIEIACAVLLITAAAAVITIIIKKNLPAAKMQTDHLNLLPADFDKPFYSQMDKNGFADPGEYIQFLIPNYIDVGPQLMQEQANEFINT